MAEHLLSIREVADRYGVATSALRYYDERGLITPAARHSGRRWYGPGELRRLSLVQLGQAIGLSLDEVATILDGDQEVWRQVVTKQIAVLDARINTAVAARAALTHTLHCPAERPVDECGSIAALLDRWTEIAGLSPGEDVLSTILTTLEADEV